MVLTQNANVRPDSVPKHDIHDRSPSQSKGPCTEGTKYRQGKKDCVDYQTGYAGIVCENPHLTTPVEKGVSPCCIKSDLLFQEMATSIQSDISGEVCCDAKSGEAIQSEEYPQGREEIAVLPIECIH